MTTPVQQRQDPNGTGSKMNSSHSAAARFAAMEYKTDCLTWLLHEQTLRTIRLGQVIAAMAVQQMAPKITQDVLAQLLSIDTPLQGAPPVMPGPLPAGA